MSFLLHRDEVNDVPFSHLPFHLSGTCGIPLSLKLSLSGQIPESITPMITPSP
ncbi:hypothetical protein GBA52_001446 [Prunus armeniaca]|nr:hypothetical protein GBA52_001446 [Prunus armeniaca]